jgi:heme-degrading monooxygenase HmoA
MVRFLRYALFSDPSSGSRKEQAMYTVIRKYDVIPGTLEEFIQHVQESLVPIINRVPGFRAYYLLEVGDNEAVAISTFDTLADARGAAKQTAAWVAEHTELFFQGFSKPMAGPVRVQGEPARLSSTSREELLRGCF